MKVIPENIPIELKKLRQWVVWRYQIRNGTKMKVPKNPRTGGNASTKIPATWGTFREAYKSYKKHKYDGIGFVFLKNDPYVGIDLDHCCHPRTGEIKPWAKQIIRRINSYSEVSPSGEGIKMIVRGFPPAGPKRRGKVEIFYRRGYFTLTGHRINSTSGSIKDRSKEIEKVFREGKEEKSLAETKSNLLSDEEIIARAKAAKNGEKFSRLWGNDIGEYSSQSEADLALAAELAFWTKGNRSAIDRLFRKSGLMRPKWDEIHDAEGKKYGEMTIEKALATYQKEDMSRGTPDIYKNVEEALDSSQKDPKNSIGRLLKDEDLIVDLAKLKISDSKKLEEFYIGLKNAGLVSRDVDALKRAVNAEKKNQRKRIQDKGPGEDRFIKKCLSDAPVPNDFLIPHGWDVNGHGVFQITKEGGRGKQISPSPIVILGRLVNRSDESEWLRLAWRRDGAWKFRNVERGKIADAKRIVDLAEHGFPIISVSAPRTVEYLSALETANSAKLPRAIVTHKLGWQGKNGRLGFLWGRNLITPGGKILSNLRIDHMSPEVWRKNLVFFKGKDQGEEEAARAFYQKGNFEKWKSAISRVKEFPIFTSVLHASLSAPLIHILKTENFIVDLAFSTSRGKTSALRIAASCWGEPDEKKTHNVIRGWDATRTWFERIPAVLNNLPFIIDDTKRARDNELAKKFIYDFASGQGSGLGSILGTRGIDSWRTVALSNGESRLVDLASGSGGANARVLSVWGSPSGKRSRKTAKLLRRVKKKIFANFGHAGKKFVRYLIRNRSKWGKWRKMHSKLIRRYQNKAGSDEVALRQAESLAVIHLTAVLVDKVLKLGIDYEAHMKKVAKLVFAAASDAHTADTAYNLTLGWASKQKDSFWQQNSQKKKAPAKGWMGAWKDEGHRELFALFPDLLEKFLKENSFESKAILREWNGKGYLDTSGEGKGLQKKFMIDGKRQRSYVVIKKNRKIRKRQ